MKLITFSGPPSSGKTSVISKMIRMYIDRAIEVGVVKFDCLQSNDDKIYSHMKIPVLLGISGEQCPDHYYISNIEDVFDWGVKQNLDILLSESAGLCNRCAPHIHDIAAVCVIDQMSGVHTPSKIGPMLQFADVVVITKSDIVSQAEREVFEMNVQHVNPHAEIIHVNGLTGQGVVELIEILDDYSEDSVVTNNKLRYSMPMALCSYCLGETNIGKQYQQGNLKKIEICETKVGCEQ
ncbi:MAG TPA: GTP-binding protein [Syntrophomonadaceae bacterium]|nr:GTP-binding protein [Syntrophomonadaceae bacterium]